MYAEPLPGIERPEEGRSPQAPPLLVSPVEAARRLGIGRSKVYELLSSGELESVHIGSRRLIPADALEAFVARLRTAEPAATESTPHGQSRNAPSDGPPGVPGWQARLPGL